MVFFFRAIFAKGVDEADLAEDLVGGEELEVDLVADEELEVYLDEELEVGLDEELEVDLDEELDVDLDEGLEVDEDESSACAPYLACQMSCLGPRTPGVKDTPF